VAKYSIPPVRSGRPDREEVVHQMPFGFVEQLDEEINGAGGEWQELEEFEGASGRTMFDTPSSRDNTVTVLLPPDQIRKVPSQSLVRIQSRPKDKGGDGRNYLGVVVQGPFAEPDGLRADAPIVVTTTVRGAMFMPRYHGRIQVEVLGEEVDDTLEPPRFRPLPNSPVFVLDETETRSILGLSGDIDLGLAVGFENMRVQIPSKRKAVLPRHVGVLGTTGSGKSTTVSGLIHQFSRAGLATIVVDTEGEYTEIGRPTNDEKMLRLLKNRDRKPEGVSDVRVYHLVGRQTTASKPTPVHPFKLEFSSLSPYSAAEILDLSSAQLDRFFKAYDVTKLLMRDFNIYPRKENKSEEREALELDEFETGYPRMTLSHLIDICGFFLNSLSSGEFEPFNQVFKGDRVKAQIKQRIATVQTSSEVSWKALLGKLWRLHRTGIFDSVGAPAIPFGELVHPGRTTIIDLSDTNSPHINNLVIANILRGLQLQQEITYANAAKANKEPTPVMIIIEEAHEFLSRERISRMQNLFEQVARIARRGRKRWLGLMFVTQLPQHLPDEVLGLVNNYILHKIADANVISRLKRSIGGIDEGLWDRIPNLAPGQAIVSATSMGRSLLVAIDPTPCKLRMTE
jgi:DNA helicase HerA-like ATPase